MNIWNLKAPSYHRLRTLPIVGRILCHEKRKLAALLCQVEVGGIVLDIGTGAGSTLDLFGESIPVIGVDRSLAMLRKALRRPRFFGVVGDAVHLPIRSCSVHAVSAIGLAEYVSDKAALLSEIKRILCPNSWFLVTVSPPGLATTLRQCLGSRIYPVRGEQFVSLASEQGFVLINRSQTWLQVQMLFRLEDLSQSD